MSDVINLGAERVRRNQAKITLASSRPVTALVKDNPDRPLDEISAEAIAALLIELEKEGIDSEHAKILMRVRIIQRILDETLAEIQDKQPITDWMKRLLLDF